MKHLRVLVIGVGAVLLVMVVATVVALTPAFQTWAVRRALAARPNLHLTIGRVSAGLRHVTLTDVRFDGARERFSAPRVDADLPVVAALWSKHVHVARLVANGWVFEDSNSAAVPHSPATPDAKGAVPVNGAHAPVDSPADRFGGLLEPIRFPFDLSLDDAVVSGTVVMPARLGRIGLEAKGGGLRPGVEGKFEVHAEAKPVDSRVVDTVNVTATVSIALASPRELQGVTVKSDVVVAGKALVRPVALQANFSALRSGTSERYAATVMHGDRALLDVQAAYQAADRPLAGTWKVDVRNADFATLARVRSLPTFTADGEGTLGADLAFSEIHATGKLKAGVAHLETLWPRLADVGPVALAVDLDLAQRGNVISVTKLHGEVVANAPVATIDALQPFEFNPGTGEVRSTDDARDLLGISLQAVPLAWAKPFVAGLELTGHAVHGELLATPRGGGFTVRTKSSLSATGVAATYLGRPLLAGVDVSLNASGDYTPRGWQAELNGMTAKSGAATMLLLDAKAGQLAGEGQPVKATGLISVDLAALGAQPLARDFARLQRGDASLEFTGSFGAARQVELKIAAKNLVMAAAMEAVLPAISATVRADVANGGQVTLSAPIMLEREGRKSDVVLSGTVVREEGQRKVDLALSSSDLIYADAKALLALVPGGAAAEGAAPVAGSSWPALSGGITLNLKHVVYSPALELRNVTGTLRLARGAVKLENVRAGVPEQGQATVNGSVTFDARRGDAYDASGDLAVQDISAITLFRLANPKANPPVEGKFNASARVKAQAPRLQRLPSATTGDVDLTSRGGVFRAMRVNVGNLVENSGKLASWIASAGSTIAGWAGRKEDYDEINSRSQAANELAKALSAIAYDQLNLVLRSDQPSNTTVKEFTLISPDIRMSGSGRMRHVAGRSVLDDELALDVQIRARGRPAELMKYLGVLDSKPDELGYAACTIPVRVGGTVGNPEAPEFSNRLIALAVEKTGILERAGARALDWINRLRGK